MGKKNRNKHKKPHSVLSSLKDLGTNSRDTLSRLATTVKADMPTLMLSTTPGYGQNGTIKSDGLPPFAQPEMKPGSKLSRFARRLVPFQKKDAYLGHSDRHTTRKMKKLAHQMAQGNPKMKIRRSRLPFVVLFFCLLLVSGGYYAAQHVSLPNVNVSQYTDFKSWLDLASGKEKTKRSPATYTTSTYSDRTDTRFSGPNVVRSYKVKPTVHASKKSSSKKTLATLKSTGKKSNIAKASYKKGGKAKVAQKSKSSAKKAGKAAKAKAGKSAKAKKHR